MMNLFDLKGKTALITGGGRGLGAQIALGYAEAGISNLVLCSRKKAACDAMKEYLEKHFNVQVLTLSCDVTNPQQVKEVVNMTIKNFEKIDILVNNSGASWAAPLLEMSKEAWDKVIDTNLTGTFLMSQAVVEEMMKQKQGKIINISSVAGFGGTPPFMQTIGYNASKAGIIALTKDLAVKLGQYNIQVNALAPGFFKTKMSSVLIEHGQDYIQDKTPLNRLGGEEDLKGASIFFATSASDYITGTVLPVDGGMSAY